MNVTDRAFERVMLNAIQRVHRKQVRVLRALCKQYKGHREYMVVVITTSGTTYTNVQPCPDNPQRFAGLRYMPIAAGEVVSGERGTFPAERIREFYAFSKHGKIERR